MGCRACSGTGTLVRVVLGPAGSLLIDRHAPGRGAWLCRQSCTELAKPECIVSAGRRRAFARALRAEIDMREVDLLLAMTSGRARMSTYGESFELGAPVPDNDGRQYETKD